MLRTPLSEARSRRASATMIALACLAALLIPSSANAQAEDALVTQSLYEDGLAEGVFDYSWAAATRMQIRGTVPTQLGHGNRAMRAFLEPWGALSLGLSESFQASLATDAGAYLEFDLHSRRSQTVLFLQLLRTNGEAGPIVEISPTYREWQHISVPVQDLGGLEGIESVWWQNATDRNARIFVDNVALVYRKVEPDDPTDQDAALLGDYDIAVITDGWGDGAVDYSWSTTLDPASVDEVSSGTSALRAELDTWGAVYAAYPGGLSLPRDPTIEAALFPIAADAVMQLAIVDADGEVIGETPIAATAGTWTTVSVPLPGLGVDGTIGGFWFQSLSGTPAQIYFDNVIIRGTAGPVGPAPTDGVTIAVSTDETEVATPITDPNSGAALTSTVTYPHPISEGVYGLNFAAPSLLAELDVPFNRWGGNSTARYNHETGSSVIGFDWYFMTDPGTPGSDHTFEAQNQAAGSETLMTVPISGWVSKGPEASCGYPLPEWGPMDDQEPHWMDRELICGNGERSGEVVPGDPRNTSAAIGPSFVQGWVEELVAEHGPAAAGGVENYALDNEPNLWFETHSDMRDGAIPRAELFDRNTTYAAAVKAGDPTASIFGPVLWGGFSYFQTNDEVAAGVPQTQVPNLVEDYLTTMRDASDDAGQRLLDTLAVNFYDDRAFGGDVSTDYRMQSPRSLWDPTWAPQDWWLVRDFNQGQSLALLPRLRAQIDAFYPDTELAITEYSFGSMDTIDGGIAQADALGIFGSQGVDVASLWDPFDPELSGDESSFVNKPVYWAYRMYRNADGDGERFGDISLFAQSSDHGAVSAYAAKRTSDGALTIMLINKTDAEQAASLRIDDPGRSAHAYRYSEADLTRIEQLDPFMVNQGVTLAPLSITMIVVG